MNVVFIIPTGIGCAIGGHAGDATPAAKMIAQTCDKIILNPNAVNASDLNEMPGNALYVEGSILDGFLRNEYELQEVLSNKILVVVNSPLQPDTINAINASSTTLGIDINCIELDTPLFMEGFVHNSHADGNYTGVSELIEQVKNYNFDALAIATEIHVSTQESLNYFRQGGINPWGGIEATVSKKIAKALKKPVAHAPIESASTKENADLFYLPFNEVVNPRIAAEVISNCYLHCVLKGLHKAPRIGDGINRSTVTALITPFGCIGEPHKACIEAGIPVIAVRENTTCFNEHHPDFIVVENYLEVAGVLSCIAAGVKPQKVRADNPKY